MKHLGVLVALLSITVAGARELPPAVARAALTYGAVAAVAGSDRWVLPGMLVPLSPTVLLVNRAATGGAADYGAECTLTPGETDLQRCFRWTSQALRIDRVVWQVAVLEYDTALKDWRKPPGLVTAGRTGQNPFALDFGAILARLPAGANPLGLTYFVRVQPVDSANRALGSPSEPVRVRVTAASGGGVAHPPGVRLVEYEPVRWQACDAEYHAVVVRDPRQVGFHWPFARPPQYRVGDKLDLTPQPANATWWGRAGQSASTALGWLSGAVSWVASGYAGIKQQALDAVGAAFGSNAETLFAVGLDLALAYYGLPPSLTNFDALTNLGKDHLAGTIADQTGLPKGAARVGLEALIAQARNVRLGGTQSKAWLAPDPDYQYRRACVTVEAANETAALSSRCVLTVTPSAPERAFYRAGSVLVPRLAPGERVRLPVLLPENEYYRALDSRNATGAAQLREWWESFARGSLVLATTLTPAETGLAAAPTAGPTLTVRTAVAWTAP